MPTTTKKKKTTQRKEGSRTKTRKVSGSSVSSLSAHISSRSCLEQPTKSQKKRVSAIFPTCSSSSTEQDWIQKQPGWKEMTYDERWAKYGHTACFKQECGHQKHRIAIVGGGASGIILGRRLAEAGIDFVLFEQKKEFGGMWNTDFSSAIEWTNPAYDHLKTNIPKEVMQLWDFDWDKNCNDDKKTSSYPEYKEVCRYLQTVAEASHLEKQAVWRRVVTNVEPLGDPDDHDPPADIMGHLKHPVGPGFKVTTQCVISHVTHVDHFSGVAVCNGHYNIPVIPRIKDKSLYQLAGGKVKHSVKWTNAEGYRGKRVVVIGSGPSARDIVLELRDKGATAIMSCRDELWDAYQITGVTYAGAIHHINDMRVVIFDDGANSGGPVDEIITATGFNYHTPFICDEVVPVKTLEKDGYKAVDNLWMQLFSCDYPNLWFMALPQNVVPWPVADAQARCISAVLQGQVQIPSRMVRYQENEQTTGRTIFIDQNRHDLRGACWNYITSLNVYAIVNAGPLMKEHMDDILTHSLLISRIYNESSKRRKLMASTGFDFRDTQYTLVFDPVPPRLKPIDAPCGGGYWICTHKHSPHPDVYDYKRKDTDMDFQQRAYNRGHAAYSQDSSDVEDLLDSSLSSSESYDP